MTTTSSKQPLILALDGHDGAGKTTLARRLATELGATYVYPFAGAEGARILASAERGEHEVAAQLSRTLLTHALERETGSVLVFDRHWMTMFTILPESYWDTWKPLPPTTLCWADLPTTRARLTVRNEKDSMPASWHQHYISLYAQLAERFECARLHTHEISEHEAAARLLAWAREEIARHG